jgi:hypothetical protein
MAHQCVHKCSVCESTTHSIISLGRPLNYCVADWVTSRSVWSLQTSSRPVIPEVCNQENNPWKSVCFPQPRDTCQSRNAGPPQASRERARPRTVPSSHDGITPQHLMYRLCANCHIYADDDYNHDRAQHQQKRRQVLVVVLAEVLRREELLCTRVISGTSSPSPEARSPFHWTRHPGI